MINLTKRSYPYVGEAKDGTEILFISPRTGIILSIENAYSVGSPDKPKNRVSGLKESDYAEVVYM